MPDWDHQLVYIDERCKKFWCGRADGAVLHVNWGRVGSDGQKQERHFESETSCQEALEKLVLSKRAKGYRDGDAATGKTENADDTLGGVQRCKLVRERDGHKLEMELAQSGKVLRTTVVETFASADDAGAAFERVKTAMARQGYHSY